MDESDHKSPDEDRRGSMTDRSDLPDHLGLDDRLWLRTIGAILQGVHLEPHPNPRVRFALDRLQVAACERAVRILASDVTSSST